MSKPQRILLSQRACIEGYPPTLNQAALLSARADVVVLDAVTESQLDLCLTPSCVKRVRVVKKPSSSRVGGAKSRLEWLWQFHREFNRQLRGEPDTVIAYDPEAISLLLRDTARTRRTQRVVHLHEMPLLENVESSPVSRAALRSTLQNLHRADLVVMPDQDRAEYVQKMVGLKEQPLVVMNCPRRLDVLPESRLLPFLRERGLPSARVVHYQGAVGQNHYFEQIVRSMRFWPRDAVFVIVGSVREQYARELQHLAEGEGVGERLVLVGRVSYDEVFSYAVGASVGVSFLNGKFLQFQLSAGASNKRFEYIALGIPQVTNQLQGVRELFVDEGVASIADETDVADIGAKISAYLEDQILREQSAARARALHLDSYNYEHQIKPLLERLGLA